MFWALPMSTQFLVVSRYKHRHGLEITCKGSSRAWQGGQHHNPDNGFCFLEHGKIMWTIYCGLLWTTVMSKKKKTNNNNDVHTLFQKYFTTKNANHLLSSQSSHHWLITDPTANTAMAKFKMFWGLPKWNSGTGGEPMLLQKKKWCRYACWTQGCHKPSVC